MIKLNSKKNGFTIAEMMVCLALISIIATILIPAIMHAKPNRNKILFKKAYMITERIVNELINDENSYKYSANGITYSGFEEVSAAVNNADASGNVKFCTLFASKLNTVEEDTNCVNDEVAFTTSDGIEWIMPITNFDDADPNTKYPIRIDVNGSEKAPNCFYDVSNCPDPDKFYIYLKRDGSVSVDDDLSKEYLKTLDTAKR